ncbi:MAG TPA: DUF5615 family PIN-like protein [Armatimonadota bacterium]|jgi:predicted nuclease of predicted toxin-antitoxin system
MRILADHCVPEPILAALRGEGHAITRLVDVADPRATDREVAELSRRLGLVLLTADGDFRRRRDFQPRRFAGIILLRDLHAAPERVLRRLLRLLAGADPSELSGALITLDRRSARERR